MKRISSHLAVAALLTMVVSTVPLTQSHRAEADPLLVPGTTPHYFGPYPNYANSQLHMTDVLVGFSGGGGQGAAATATVNPTTGAVTGFTVDSGGSGYTSAPSVAITSPLGNGTGATATAAIARGVTSVTVTDGGHGYTQPPAISFTDSGDGAGATATATMSGYVGSILVGLGGLGYSSPTVTVEPPDAAGGVTALAHAVVNGQGTITSIVVDNRGSGYTTEPGVAIRNSDGTPGSAAAKALVTMDAIATIDIDSTGIGYTAATVVIPAPPSTPPVQVGLPTQATATAAVSGAVITVNPVTSGSGYVTPDGIRKFVDELPGLGQAGENNLHQYIPIAVADTTTYPGSDYYEIGVVQFREKVHTNIPATLFRGYVQLDTSVIPGSGVALTNADLNPLNAAHPVLLNGQQVYGVDNPHQYGPFIQATKDRPVRILFRNLLPTGVGGDLFIPVDTTVMGSGMGPTGASLVENDPYNPMCGQTPKPVQCYTENRATLHLHGGITPWISDGTPHQWITPATDSTLYPKGVSVQNVPDMPDPGPGAMTFFYSNQQSARLLFYHDHSYGITRLNVYAGEAAGYMITDATEQALINSGTIPSDQIPLIIADKTFVPKTTQLASEDPTWNAAKWGGEGNLWQPHVYMPAQNPTQTSGANTFGRWAYGPWFWPPTVGIDHGPRTNPYYRSEPGTGPMGVDCNTDVQDFCEPQLIPGVPSVSMGMEAFADTPLVNGTAYPYTELEPKSYRFRILNAANDRYWNLQLYQADSSGTEVALKASEVAAALDDPTVFPTPDLTRSPEGPKFVQIGTEGGFLPTPVTIPNQPITWVTDPTVFNAGNVDQHALLVGPAERVDVIVDFSKFAGKTLILYNDAPAAFPARDARYDYYTGNGDLRSIGGAPSTLPGYGPNTRTIMQIRVAASPVALPFNMTRLTNAFKHDVSGTGVFETSQAPIVVGQGAYNAALGTKFRFTAPFDGYVRITDGALTFKSLASNTTDGIDGTSTTIPLQFKAMHDEMGASFDPVYGRMSGNMGLEDPGALANAQNIYLYPYINPSTENFDGIELPPGVQVTPMGVAGTDGTQIWKITHNGVDTHAMHWHLYDVQLINRVGWDGIIRPPDANELGWKDTVRVSPLEDTFVAMRPIIPKLPFGVPDSVRLLDPTMPENSTASPFNQTGPGGAVLNITNVKVNMGWEYVWHCHLLSHEEMDMMRPVQVAVTTAKAAAPTLSRSSGFTFTWSDPTPMTTSVDSWGRLDNEIGFRLERAEVVGNATGSYSTVAGALANQTTVTDSTATSGHSYKYRVVAYNTAGDSYSNVVAIGGVTMSGRVSATGITLDSGTRVSLYTSAGTIVSTTPLDGSGNYSFSSVAAGSYKLYIVVSPAGSGYNTQWFDGKTSQGNASTLTVGSQNITQNIALSGSPIYPLSGTVTTTGGSNGTNGLVGATMTFYDSNGNTKGTTTTSTGGAYTIKLAAGQYRVYFSAKSPYPAQWFGGTKQSNATFTALLAPGSTQNLTVHP